jgi:hypothetical protein
MTDAEHLVDIAKRGVDAAAVTTAFGSLLVMMPHIATTLSALWVAIRIYETETVQKLIRQIAHAYRRLCAWLGRKG